ncbi:hypothetical protein FOL47_003746 [Perkinsus chesapeaki]|uniref:Uncharacterized protein n=1 Tax=Perkinsus chesapeaki TaxID=330153 RepID=A0A7J6M6J9_PERCH|nr:hypothetical protein FOL47_003746 [Perkinsus chesapeaki]
MALLCCGMKLFAVCGEGELDHLFANGRLQEDRIFCRIAKWGLSGSILVEFCNSLAPRAIAGREDMTGFLSEHMRELLGHVNGVTWNRRIVFSKLETPIPTNVEIFVYHITLKFCARPTCVREETTLNETWTRVLEPKAAMLTPKPLAETFAVRVFRRTTSQAIRHMLIIQTQSNRYEAKALLQQLLMVISEYEDAQTQRMQQLKGNKHGPAWEEGQENTNRVKQLEAVHGHLRCQLAEAEESLSQDNEQVQILGIKRLLHEMSAADEELREAVQLGNKKRATWVEQEAIYQAEQDAKVKALAEICIILEIERNWLSNVDGLARLRFQASALEKDMNETSNESGRHLAIAEHVESDGSTSIVPDKCRVCGDGRYFDRY